MPAGRCSVFSRWHFRFALRLFSFIGVSIFLLVLVFRKGGDTNFQNVFDGVKEPSFKKRVNVQGDFWQVCFESSQFSILFIQYLFNLILCLFYRKQLCLQTIRLIGTTMGKLKQNLNGLVHIA